MACIYGFDFPMQAKSAVGQQKAGIQKDGNQGDQTKVSRYGIGERPLAHDEQMGDDIGHGIHQNPVDPQEDSWAFEKNPPKDKQQCP